MRSTLDILIAVKDRQPVEPEELRLALLVMDFCCHQAEHRMRTMAEKIEAGTKSNSIVAGLQAQFSKQTIESNWTARRADPEVFLGPTNIPGNPEHDTRYDAMKTWTDKLV